MRNSNLVLLALVAIYLLAVALAFGHGQGTNPPASTKESDQTSAVATSASDSRVLMEEMTTTEVLFC